MEFEAEEPALAPERVAQRYYVDCREVPSEKHCSLVLAGTMDEVLNAAVEHATGPVHGHTDTLELRAAIRNSMHPVKEGSGL